MCELRQDHWLLWVTYKKLISFYLGFFNNNNNDNGRWLAILCNMKAALKSLDSL